MIKPAPKSKLYFCFQNSTEEWITKRKTELTTTRQIETRVKRQVKLQDGKVIEDSGPIVSTNTTEDTDKQETETTEVSCSSTHAFQQAQANISLHRNATWRCRMNWTAMRS